MRAPLSKRLLRWALVALSLGVFGLVLAMGGVEAWRQVLRADPLWVGVAFACTAALTTLQVMETDDLPGNAARVGAWIVDTLKKELGAVPGVKEIRGQGLIIGIELDRPCGDLVKMALADKLLINVTSDNVVRLIPPLVMNQEEAALLTDKLTALVWNFLN